MKYIKKFESLRKPQVGDYVQLQGDYFDSETIDFIRTHIGRIKDIDLDEYGNPTKDETYPYLVEFDEILPLGQRDNKKEMNFDLGEIEKFASTKWELENKKDLDKYNI